MAGPVGVPPEIRRAAEAEADALWAAIEKDMPDSVDLSLVKPHVTGALLIAFSQGALLVSRRGVEALQQISDKKPRQPRN